MLYFQTTIYINILQNKLFVKHMHVPSLHNYKCNFEKCLGLDLICVLVLIDLKIYILIK